jgi:invasion protein IalB
MSVGYRLGKASRAAAMIAAVALLAGPAGVALAQDQPQPESGPKTVKVGPSNGENPQPWVVNCTTQTQGGELSCVMTQVLVAQQSNQRIIGATVYRATESGPADLRLNLPHGILLQKGVDVWVDLASPTNYPITIADQNGSYSTIELSGPMIVSLQGGAFLNVAVTAANGDRVQFQLSLKGFTNAFAKL